VIGLIPRPRSPTKCLKDPKVKRKIRRLKKGLRKKEKEEVISYSSRTERQAVAQEKNYGKFSLDTGS
jgi:hypothetical protein